MSSMPEMFPQAAYCVLDIETTGFDPVKDDILQIAWCLLDKDFAPIIAIHAFGATYVVTDKPVTEWGAMSFHQKTGFLARYQAVQANRSAVHKTMVEVCLGMIVPKGCVLVGNQVEAFDRAFLKVHMPALAERFTHNIINVSSIRDVYCVARGINRYRVKESFGFDHDAWGDVCACIKELKFYRKLMEVTP